MKRRGTTHLGLALRLLVVLLATQLPATARAGSGVTRVASVGMTVADVDRSVAFFTDVLTFEKISDVEITGAAYERLEGVFGLHARVVTLRLGDETIELTQYLAPEGRPLPSDSRSNDRWFQHVAIIVSDMDKAYARLREHHVRHASTGPQLLPKTIPNAAGIRAFYFKDPDGHSLEILQFPPDKGDPKWHGDHGGRLFLGIDHTAIVVGDTAASLAFYRDVLGFQVVGESENFGTEQEHLNNVFGARLRITGLRSPGGPGVELLEYLAPRDGRATPSDLRANDVAHWTTRMVASDLGASELALRRAHAQFVSPGTVAVPPQLGFRSGLGVTDPDGHVVELVAP